MSLKKSLGMDLRGRKTGVHLHPLFRNENVL